MKMKNFNISMTQYTRGDIITGTIVMIGATEVVVAIGGLKEGVFPKSELDPAFKIGDAILDHHGTGDGQDLAVKFPIAYEFT